jgi:hypothetical protein
MIYPDLKLITVDSIAENKHKLKLIKVDNLMVGQPFEYKIIK